MAKLITSKEEHEKSNIMKSEPTDFSKLIEAAWVEPELKFLTTFNYFDAKAWFDKMLETWEKDVAPNLKPEDTNVSISEKALAVKRFRKEKNEKKRLKQV